MITRIEAIQVMERAHFTVFGMSNEQRKARKAEIKPAISDTKAGIFDIPAVEWLFKR